MKTTSISLLAASLLASVPAVAQYGHTLHSLESLVSGADLVVSGSVVEANIRQRQDEQRLWLDVTVKVDETIKGPELTSVTFAYQILEGDERWEQFVESGQQQLWFLLKSRRPEVGVEEAEAAIRALHPYRTGRFGWPWIRLGEEVDGERSYSRPPPPIFTMHFELLTEREPVLAAARAAAAAQPEGPPKHHALYIPRSLADRTGSSGDANAFIVPADRRLEALAIRLIESSEEILADGRGDDVDQTSEQREAGLAWAAYSADSLRAEAVKALSGFKSPENISRLEALLDHPAKVERAGTNRREYFIRSAAYEVLTEWGLALEKPALHE